MTEHQILSAIRNSNDSLSYVDLLNYGRTDEKYDPHADTLRIRHLISSGLLSGKTEAYSILSLTPSGNQRLDDLNHQADEKRRDRAYAERREDRALKVGLISGLISAIVSVGLSALVNILFNLH